MKYMQRANIYKASNVTFSKEDTSAFSYDWWQFVRVINGSVVFNSHYYSPTTCRHQSKVRTLMRELNIEIDICINTRMGLQACNGVHSHQELANESMTQALQAGELERAQKIAQVFKVKLTQDFMQSAYDNQEETLCSEYLERAYTYSEKKRHRKYLALKIKLTEYLEDDCAFRDYNIYASKDFGSINGVAFHQCVSLETLEHDVDNALCAFTRDGFPTVNFYLEVK